MSGYNDSQYFLPPFDFYPAHRLITSPGPYQGKTLAEVPAKDWPTLIEVTEKPLSYGPYKVKEWIKGDRIVYEPNHYFFLGSPKTPNIIVRFIAPEAIETQLIDGSIDVVGSETLYGLTEQLILAESQGKVKNFSVAGSVWEHLDFNLEIFSEEVPLSQSQGGTLTYDGGITSPITVTVPGGSVSSTDVSMKLTPLIDSAGIPIEGGSPNGLSTAGAAFRLEVLIAGVPQTSGYTFSKPITVTVSTAGWSAQPDTAALYLWNGSTWEDAYLTCPVDKRSRSFDLIAQTFSTTICHLTEFQLFGEPYHRVHIPFVYR